MRRVGILAAVTLREAGRKKILLAATVLGAAYLGMFALGLHFQCMNCVPPPNRFVRQAMDGGLLMVGLYGVDFLTALLAILASIDSLSGEIASGTIQAMATKPLGRWELVVGKWLGFACLLAAYVAAVGGGTILLMAAGQGYRPPHILAGLSLIWLEGVLLLSVTLLFGTFCSTLTSGVLAIGLYGLAFMGGWVEQIGALLHHPAAVQLGIVASLIMPSEALWRRAVFEMQTPLMGVLNFSPFSTASVPSRLMLAYAVAYIALATATAVRHFSVRDL